MNNYFKATPECPYHLSVGAILVNDEGKICTHYFKSVTHESVGTLADVQILMRETVEPNESLETVLARGLMEEFGARGEMLKFIGPQVCDIPYVKHGGYIKKTTLYFLCKLIDIDESKRKIEDPESSSVIVWADPLELIEKMKEQATRIKRTDANESEIVERYLGLAK